LRDVKALTLDLSKVQQTDSAGLALLLEWLAQANRQGCRVSIQGLPASLLSVARMCHLDGLLASQTVKSGE
jgi:phospholipid transport system transporter-binding protein